MNIDSWDDFNAILAITSKLYTDDYMLDFEDELKEVISGVEFMAIKNWYPKIPDNRALFLPTPKKNKGSIIAKIRPLLKIERVENNSKKISMTIIFVYSVEGSLSHYAFRYETPELDGDRNKSMHNYHHSQLVFNQEFAKIPTRIINSFKPVGIFCPDSLPAFPLVAKSTIELLISMLISIYGWNYFYTNLFHSLPDGGKEAYDNVKSACGCI